MSTLVHEVKNPLVAISTFAHLLPERYEEEEFRGEFSRLVGVEVKRLNGVLEMLLEYGQLGAPRPHYLDLPKWLRNYADERRWSSNQRISMDFSGSLPRVQFDERHLNFILERIFAQIQSRGIAGGDIRICGAEAATEENLVKYEILYDEQGSYTQTPVRSDHSIEEQDFEGLSLGLGLARRIMKKNHGEMSVLPGEGKGTRILLQFSTRAFGQPVS